MKYLGLLLDEKLNYNEHVQSIRDSLLNYFGIFNHITHKVTKKTARQLQFAFVFPRILNEDLSKPKARNIDSMSSDKYQRYAVGTGFTFVRMLGYKIGTTKANYMYVRYHFENWFPKSLHYDLAVVKLTKNT